MKYWINYGQIIHSLYRKYFSNPVKKEITFSGGQTNSEFKDDDMAMEWDDDDDVNEVLSTKTNVASKEENKDLYIVVDTNIFLSDLNILQEIVRCGSSGGTKPVFYIPWMVLSELDFMKDDKTTSSDLKSRANEAVHFINKTLIEGDRKLIGQNIYDTEKQSYVGKSPDDKILACCLQAREKFHNVIFLSNDVNLRNKLLVNGIPALSTTEMLRNIDDKEEVSATAKLHEKIEKVFETMSNCCSFIICECAEEAYGTIWKNMAMLNNPPWPLKVCLKIFKKYWSSVFREKLLKQCLKAVQQLTEILRELEISKSPDKFEEFVRGCISLCIFLKDLEEFRNFVEGTITDIKSITDCQ
ncbi:hypothetical protein HHI36_019569 [Cryptolaemus montrouzieri]|uniref:PIN domain-containing protein n=1 Tax=Cryptolaemus montrouzieri TaxID=559131 RepID=A0ABD2N7M0_9CUCU